jgi:hypothetical protein
MSESRIRLIKQLSSSIFSFSGSDPDNKFRSTKKISRDFSDTAFTHGGSRNQTPTSPYLRPVDHSINDLFGNFPTQFYRKDIKGIYTSPAIKPRSKDQVFEKISNRRSLDISSGLRNHVELKKDLNKKDLARSSSPNSDILIPKPQEARIECISISGLKPFDDEISIKDMCRGLHLVQVNADLDNITGKCLGKANLQIRTNGKTSEVEMLKMKLIEKGLEVSFIASSRGRKNNYHGLRTNFLDSQLQKEEKRLNSNLLSSRERKRVILGTSDDLFGNSPGTGRWDTVESTQSDFKETKENRENLRKWEITKKLLNTSPNKSKSSAGYSKPTISSASKYISRR